jgi:hypothetical protein
MMCFSDQGNLAATSYPAMSYEAVGANRLNAVWNRSRRLVTSIMLVAVTSFVLHGGPTASHAHGPAPNQQHATHHHAGESASLEHRADVAQVHAAGGAHEHAFAQPCDQNALAGDHHGSGEAWLPCCGSLCSFVLAPIGSETQSVLLATAALIPVSQFGSGIDPNGLKRPPRTPCIA